jgi:hypothetical protein
MGALLKLICYKHDATMHFLSETEWKSTIARGINGIDAKVVLSFTVGKASTDSMWHVC